MKTFGEWCAEVHPEVRLLPWQEGWVNAMEGGGLPVVLLGRGTGKSFVERLWLEYVEAVG